MWSYTQTKAMGEDMSNGNTKAQRVNQVILTSNTLSWYVIDTSSNYPGYQINSSNVTYIWLCIG